MIKYFLFLFFSLEYSEARHTGTAFAVLSKFRSIGHNVRKRTFCNVPPTKNQISLMRSLISLRCPLEETLHLALSKIRSVKILMRLRGCAG